MTGGTLDAGGVSLRRAQPRDLEAVLALQQAAYARNRVLLGCEPLPLLADYQQIFRDYEVWLADADSLSAVLILELRPDDLLIWSIATDPANKAAGSARSSCRRPRCGRENWIATSFTSTQARCCSISSTGMGGTVIVSSASSS